MITGKGPVGIFSVPRTQHLPAIMNVHEETGAAGQGRAEQSRAGPPAGTAVERGGETGDGMAMDDDASYEPAKGTGQFGLGV